MPLRVSHYLSGFGEHLYPTGKEETFSARPDVGDVLEAKEEAPPDADVAVAGVLLVPVLVEPEKPTHVAPADSSLAVRLWKTRVMMGDCCQEGVQTGMQTVIAPKHKFSHILT